MQRTDQKKKHKTGHQRPGTNHVIVNIYRAHLHVYRDTFCAMRTKFACKESMAKRENTRWLNFSTKLTYSSRSSGQIERAFSVLKLQLHTHTHIHS